MALGPTMMLASGLAAAGLASVHLLSNVLRLLDGIPRSRFLSIAGGMSVSFVFVRLNVLEEELPEERQIGWPKARLGRSIRE